MPKAISEPPAITPDQLVTEEARRPTPMHAPGQRLKCPSCGERTFEWTSELERTVPKPGVVVVLKHLTRYRCPNCEAEGLDFASAMHVSREENGAQPVDYALALTKQGERRAIFLNQDLMRIARLDDVEEVIVAPVRRDNWLARLVRRGDQTPPHVVGLRRSRRGRAR